jgi:hypothetical protein
VEKKGYCRAFIFLFAFWYASHTFAEDEPPAPESYSALIWDYLTNGSSLTIGVGGREADLTVKRLSDNASGKLVQRNEKSYFLSYSTRPAFFGNSHFGYDFVFNLSTFNMDEQEISKNVYQNLGTSASGRFAYVVPTVFYMWGDHRRGTYFKTGIGFGAGIASFDGNIILTDSTTQDRVNFSNQSTKPRLASSIVLEARWNNWGLLVTSAGPDFQQDGYEYQISDIAISFGYRYVF